MWKETIDGGKRYYYCTGNKYMYVLSSYQEAKKLIGHCTGFDKAVTVNDAEVYETEDQNSKLF